MVRPEDQESDGARKEIQKAKAQLDKALERVRASQAEAQNRKRLSPVDHVKIPVSLTRLRAEVFCSSRVRCSRYYFWVSQGS